MIFVVGGAYQGKTEYVKEKFPDYTVVSGYHRIVKEQLKEGLDPIAELEKFLCENSSNSLVIISDDIGSGLVPIDKEDREYREMSGRVNCKIAAAAEEVIRVICGIGTRIK